jgi:hypothetical protein
MARPLASPRAQRGSGTLPLVLILLFTLALVLLDGHRALIAEQRAVAGQVRGAQAHEAAEAGIAWALAQLNRSGPVDGACAPIASPAASATSLRERLLRSDLATGPATATVGSSVVGLRAVGAACTFDADWRCDCPLDVVPPAPTVADATQPHPAFAIAAQGAPGDAARAGVVRLTVTGCSQLGTGCGGGTEPDARTELRVLLAPYGGLMQAPGAALTALGAVDLGGGATLVNGDPRGNGLAVHAAGPVTVAPGTRLLGPPGRPAATAVLALDAQLGDTAAPWRRLFGLPAERLRTLPTLRRIACPVAGCGAADLQPLLDAGHRHLWLDGGLQLTSPVDWGRPDAGLLLLIDGPAQWQGPLAIEGLVLARSVQWLHPGAGVARLRGALVSLGAVSLQGAVELVRAPEHLERLRDAAGAYVLLPGSWQDFVNR